MAVATPLLQQFQQWNQNPGMINQFNSQNQLGVDQGLNFNDVMAGIQAISQGIGAYTGLRQLSLAKDSFNFNKDVTETNLANQAKLTNSQLEDRQRARIASNPNAYQSLSEYMDKNAVSGRLGG